jgi:branched-chain amino acid transport system permease protein
MNTLLKSANVYVKIILFSLSIGLLVLPFTGTGNAVRFSAAALASFFLWRLSKSKVFLSVARPLSRFLAIVYEKISSLSRAAQSPLAYAGFIVFLIFLPAFLNDYYQDIMTLTGIYIVLALGLNIVVGQAGLLNLGYVAFYAIGAYTYAILSTTLGLAFWPGLLAGATVAALFAFIIGLPTLRLRGDYFAIVTLGLGEITRIILNNWDGLTGGPNGISRIGRPVLAGYSLHSTLDFYYVILVIVVITVFAMKRLMTSRIGRAWIAIREDEVAAEAMGINTFRLKLLAFVVGSALAGLTGVFFAAKMAFVSPESFTFSESVLILCMVVLGGMGSIPGIVLGALLLITLPEIFRDFQDYRMLAFGIALVAMMVFRPQGLLGTVKK